MQEARRADALPVDPVVRRTILDVACRPPAIDAREQRSLDPAHVGHVHLVRLDRGELRLGRSLVHRQHGREEPAEAAALPRFVRRPSTIEEPTLTTEGCGCMHSPAYPTDRIKDTISSLQSDKARLTEENLELRQRIARVELRNAVLERGEGGDASIAPVGWADSEIDEPEGDVDDDARSWASSALDEGDHEMVADKSDDGQSRPLAARPLKSPADAPNPCSVTRTRAPETTPLGRPETHPANELYSSFTPPVSTHALPPTPQVEQIPTFAPDTRVSPPSVLGLVASQTALGHCLFRTAPPKHVLSGAPSPIFPQSALSFAAGQPAILGTTPSNVLGLQLDSLAVAHPVDNPFDDVRAAHAQREGDEAMTDVDGSAPVAWSFQH
jgi:hypothetical protein